ncbi:MAG: FKBP-type peptidyl-prolyl cis-trans isomerase [Treponema sp.]|jgi:FKBP-type peptidyl-prolyl cis-trans isomerase|nr:FKBP-type peptidyl-prolyl cis-trans isomerase [Treponema sp.]
MKKINIILAILPAILVFGGCKGKLNSPIEKNFDNDASYALGMNIGANLNADGIIPNPEQFLLGMKDMLSGRKTRFTEDEAMQKIQMAFSDMIEKRGSEAMQKGNEFLAENSKKPGITTTSSGLQYEVIKEGNGAKPSAFDVVRVHYEGTLIDGTVFDSSYDRGSPIEFPLDGVIAGWTEGVQLMGVGSKYKLYIPSELGYGAGGAGPIPPNSALIFEVELLDIIN